MILISHYMSMGTVYTQFASAPWLEVTLVKEGPHNLANPKLEERYERLLTTPAYNHASSILESASPRLLKNPGQV